MSCASVEDNQAYTCDICGAKLSRPAHLQRHRLVHSANSQESFHCQLCDKRFTRKDVYQRHKRGVHGDSQTSRGTGRKKSCRRCIQYKLRCTRQVPCSACLNKGTECVFETRKVPRIAEDLSSSRSEEHNSDIALSANRQELSSNNTADTTTSNSSPIASTNATAVTLSQHNEVSASCSETDGGVPRPSEVHMENLNTHHIQDSNSNYYSTLRHQEMGFFQSEDRRLQPDWEISNTTSFLSPPAEYSHLDEEGYCLAYSGNHERLEQNHNMEDQQQHIDPSLQIDSFDRNFFRSSRLDWLDWETDMSDKQTIPPDDQRSNGFSPGSAIQETENPTVNPDNSRARSLSTVPRSLLPPEHPPTINLPRIADREGNETWPGILDRGGNEMWPFDYTSNKGFRKIKLPPLRQILEQTVGERPAIEKTTLLDLIKVLSAPFIPSFNDSPALEALPAVAFLGQFMKIYFAEFHAVLPVIHIPTWRIEKCPTALLAAMACIGATYSTAEGSTEVSALLAEITQRALFWMGQSDSTAFRNPAYITASCFHQIYSLGSGNRRLYEIADASRGLLVTSLRGLGALSSESEHEEASTFEFQDLKKLDPDALEASWLRWRDKEMEKRIAWSVFEFDCTLTTLTSKRGAFNISELPPKLPCAESIWEAHSAHAWASMVTFCKSPPSGLPFYPLLREIMAQKSTLETVPAWAKRLCAQAIGRLLWDFREIEEASSPAIFGFPSLAASYQDTRLNLLRSLTILHDSLSNPTCTSDLVNLNIACLGTHYCYLNNGNEAMDLVVYIFRNSGREKSISVSNGLIRAKEHLRNIFIRSPVESRRQVCHAASIVGISRECTIHAPCESMRVFMGFAFLLAFAKFFPFQRQEKDHLGPPENGSERPAIKLDELPWRRSAEDSHHLEKWVTCGGRASLESVGNICDGRNFEELKRIALETMRGLRVWGIAGKFCRIMKVFG